MFVSFNGDLPWNNRPQPTRPADYGIETKTPISDVFVLCGFGPCLDGINVIRRHFEPELSVPSAADKPRLIEVFIITAIVACVEGIDRMQTRLKKRFGHEQPRPR